MGLFIVHDTVKLGVLLSDDTVKLGHVFQGYQILLIVIFPNCHDVSNVFIQDILGSNIVIIILH